jgi:hypothetical protein
VQGVITLKAAHGMHALLNQRKLACGDRRFSNSAQRDLTRGSIYRHTALSMG